MNLIRNYNEDLIENQKGFFSSQNNDFISINIGKWLLPKSRKKKCPSNLPVLAQQEWWLYSYGLFALVAADIRRKLNGLLQSVWSWFWNALYQMLSSGLFFCFLPRMYLNYIHFFKNAFIC